MDQDGIKVFDEVHGAMERYATEEEVVKFGQLGYPCDDPFHFYMKQSNSESNPGRFYWSYQFTFLGWIDEAIQPYDEKKLNRRIQAAKANYERFKTGKQSQALENRLRRVELELSDLRSAFDAFTKQFTTQ